MYDIAQCVFPRLNIPQYLEDSSYRATTKELVKLGVGGFCVFGGTSQSVPRVIGELQFMCEIPLLFCADFEHGLPMRLHEGGTAFPHHLALAKASAKYPDRRFTYLAARAIAREARSIGVLWNLAPVCDINSNPQNPVINIRSFGSSVKTVCDGVREYIEGTRDEHVATCAKHFPGHGDTATDSHLQIPVINKSTLPKGDITRPFTVALGEDSDAIMIGHLDPGTGSTREDLWRKHIKEIKGYRWWCRRPWATVTDALDMQAIVEAEAAGKFCRWARNPHGVKGHTTPESHAGDAACSAFAAGVDILLMPAQPLTAIDALERELHTGGKRWRDHLAEALQRIRAMKEFVGLLPAGKPTVGLQPQLFTEHMQLALKIAMAATDVEPPLKGKSLLLSDGVPFAAFSILQREEDLQAASRFFTMLGQATENDCDFAYLDEDITTEQLADMAAGILDAELLVFALFYKGRGYSQRLGNADKINGIVRALAAGRPVIVVCLGDPYIAEQIDGDTKVLTYSDSFASLAAAVAVLTGRNAG